MVLVKSVGKVTTFDFREKAPLAASPSMFLDENGKIKDNSNHIGLLTVGVPGTVAGLYQAQQKYGKLPWAALVQPAIDQAKNGFPMSWGLYNAAVRMSGLEASFDIMQKVAVEGFGNPDLHLYAPFVGIGKHDIAALGAKLGVPYVETWSCYKGGEIHCGKCGTCVERKEAFELAGVLDPTEYE